MSARSDEYSPDPEPRWMYRFEEHHAAVPAYLSGRRVVHTDPRYIERIIDL